MGMESSFARVASVIYGATMVSWLLAMGRFCWSSESIIRQPNLWIGLIIAQFGRGIANKIRIVARGSRLELFVNDALVGTAQDGALTSGKVGLYVQTYGLHVRTEYIRVWQP